MMLYNLLFPPEDFKKQNEYQNIHNLKSNMHKELLTTVSNKKVLNDIFSKNSDYRSQNEYKKSSENEQSLEKESLCNSLTYNFPEFPEFPDFSGFSDNILNSFNRGMESIKEFFED